MWQHVEVLDDTETYETILKELTTIFYFAFTMRKHQWLVKAIIHGKRYGQVTLFIQDRKPWFTFILVAWNGLDPPCRAAYDASCPTSTFDLEDKVNFKGKAMLRY